MLLSGGSWRKVTGSTSRFILGPVDICIEWCANASCRCWIIALDKWTIWHAFTKVIMIHPLGNKDVCAKYNCFTSNICQDISLLNKLKKRYQVFSTGWAYTRGGDECCSVWRLGWINQSKNAYEYLFLAYKLLALYSFWCLSYHHGRRENKVCSPWLWALQSSSGSP